VEISEDARARASTLLLRAKRVNIREIGDPPRDQHAATLHGQDSLSGRGASLARGRFLEVRIEGTDKGQFGTAALDEIALAA